MYCGAIDETRRDTYYVLVILEIDDDLEEYGDRAIADVLSGFTDNKWLFHQYLKQFSSIIDHTRNIISRYDNVTYDEFRKMVIRDTGYIIKQEDMIFSIETSYGDILMCNDNLLEQLYEYNSGYDSFEEIFQVSYSECFILFNAYKIYFKESFDIICKVVNRAWLYLMALMYYMEIGYMRDNDDSGLLKLLNESLQFPTGLENMEYPDIYDENYMLTYVLDSVSTIYGDIYNE